MVWQQVLAVLLLVGCSAQVAHSFYLPGVAPQDFKKGDAIYLKVNKVCLTSIHALLCAGLIDTCHHRWSNRRQQHALDRPELAGTVQTDAVRTTQTYALVPMPP
jgi:hypothetical protein